MVTSVLTISSLNISKCLSTCPGEVYTHQMYASDKVAYTPCGVNPVAVFSDLLYRDSSVSQLEAGYDVDKELDMVNAALSLCILCSVSLQEAHSPLFSWSLI